MRVPALVALIHARLLARARCRKVSRSHRCAGAGRRAQDVTQQGSIALRTKESVPPTTDQPPSDLHWPRERKRSRTPRRRALAQPPGVWVCGLNELE